MPITPFHAQKVILTKSPRQGNDEVFSVNGSSTVEIIAWEVWNSRNRTRVSHYSKIFGDEVSVVFRTHNVAAAELECDDALKSEKDRYTYSVQSVREIKTPLNLNSKDYEIAVK